MNLKKKVTIQEVIGREYKSEITALASEMAGGAKSGSKEAFGNYKKALKTFMDSLSEDAKAEAETERQKWEMEGKPEEVKIRLVTIHDRGHPLICWLLAMLKKMGRRSFVRRLKCNSAN